MEMQVIRKLQDKYKLGRLRESKNVS